MEAIEYLLGKKPVGDNVVVIGGGLTGCEIAYDLCLHGKKPVIVEMQDDLITAKGVCLANTSYLRDYFKTNRVPVYLETAVSEIGKDSVTLKDKTGRTFTVAADTVILSVGYDPGAPCPQQPARPRDRRRRYRRQPAHRHLGRVGRVYETLRKQEKQNGIDGRAAGDPRR